MGLLIYAAITALLSFFLVRNRSRLLFLVLQFFPFIFLFLFLWATRENYQILQIRKIGYQFEKGTNDFRQPTRVLFVGGDRRKDDLFFEGLPPKAIQISPALGDPTITVEITNGGFLLFNDKKLLNHALLRAGDKIQCGSQELVFHSRGSWHRSFRAGSKEWKWPKRRWRLGKKQEEELRAQSQHHLGEIARALDLKCESDAVVRLERVVFSGTQQLVQFNAVTLAAADSQIRLNGKTLPNRFAFSTGDILRIVRLNGSSLSALRPIASFRVRNAETLELLHSAPRTLGVKEELLRNGSAQNKPLFVTTTSLPYSVFPTAHYGQESAKFEGLFAYVQTRQIQPPSDFGDRIEWWIRKPFQVDSGDFDIVTEQGAFRPSYGDYFTLGRKDKLILAIQQVDFPWTLLLSALVLFMLKMLYQPPFYAAVEHPALQLMIITLDFFFVSRILFSFRASNLYPFSQEATELSLLVLLLLPYILFSVSMITKPGWTRNHSSNFVCYSALTLLGGFFITRGLFWLVLLTVLLFAFGAVLRFHPRWNLRAMFRFSEVKSISVEGLLLFFFIFALLLQLLGTGEAIQFAGIRFPLALIYHPSFLLLSSFYLYRLKKILQMEKSEERWKRAWKAILYLFLTVLCFLVVSLFTADLGFFLLYCIPIVFLLLGLGVLWSSEYELRSKALAALLIAPVALFLIVFSGSQMLDRILPVSYFGNPYIQRILLTVNPSALEESGLIATEKQLGHQKAFLAYAHSGIFGGGYMNQPVTSALATTSLNDNVPSVFLLGDFGAFGLLAVLIIFLLWSWLWFKASQGVELNYGAMLGLSALITIIFVGIYMIFSNSGIFFFTGKNVFLWGLNSISDLFHAAILFSFLVIGGKSLRTSEVSS